MIVLKLIGGLGNQMFQIAFARYLSLETNDKIYIDASVYEKYKIRDFSLDNLFVSDFYENYDQVDLTKKQKLYLKYSQKFYHLIQKILISMGQKGKIGNFVYSLFVKRGLIYNFDVHYYNEKPYLKNNDIKCIYGYFQSEKYFLKYKTQIKEEMKVKIIETKSEKSLINQVRIENSVAISLRLGQDYKQSKLLNICTEEYYLNSVKYMIEKIKKPVFFIFSDDIDEAKRIFKDFENFIYIEGFQDYQSLRIMYNCKHFIISNSSFSWWGSYLSDNYEKIIISPDHWYNGYKNPDIYTENMIKYLPSEEKY